MYPSQKLPRHRSTPLELEREQTYHAHAYAHSLFRRLLCTSGLRVCAGFLSRSERVRRWETSGTNERRTNHHQNQTKHVRTAGEIQECSTGFSRRQDNAVFEHRDAECSWTTHTQTHTHDRPRILKAGKTHRLRRNNSMYTTVLSH